MPGPEREPQYTRLSPMSDPILTVGYPDSPHEDFVDIGLVTDRYGRVGVPAQELTEFLGRRAGGAMLWLCKVDTDSQKAGEVLKAVCGRIVLDLEQKLLFLDGQETLLTPTEFKMLEVFMRNPNVVITRSRMAELAWSNESDQVSDNLVQTFVSNLRKKLRKRDEALARVLETRRGFGYVFNTNPTDSPEPEPGTTADQ